MPLKQEVAQRLTGEWQVGLFEAPCAAPLSFCYGCCCICCMAGQQRLEILDVIGEPYVCCGGLFPCGPLGEPQDRGCVWLEACCCPSLAVSGNRLLIQTRFDRQNTACDDCILWSTCLASWAVCLCQCAGCDVPQEIENCVECMKMIVDGCMLAQQQVEIQHVQQTGFVGPNPALVAALPPFQQQMIHQAKPMGGAATAGILAGAAVGGAAGAAAMYGVAGHPQATRPPPQTMGHPVAPLAGMPGGPEGFMGTMAPNGMPWCHYCQGRQIYIDPSSGLLMGPWGECLAWAKMFEIQNPGWDRDPRFVGGPCGQVISAMLATSPAHLRAPAERAADLLEASCEQAARAGTPLPVIGQRA